MNRVIREARTPEQIWQNTNQGAVESIEKLFRKYGFNTLAGSREYSIRTPDNELVTVDTPWRTEAYKDANPFIVRIGRDRIEDYETSDRLPEDIKDKLLVLSDFIKSHLIERPLGTTFDKMYISRPENKKTLKQRAEPYKAAKKALANIVPEGFFDTWRVSLSEDITCNDDSDDGCTNYTYVNELGFSFEDKSDKDRFFYIIGTVGARGYAYYKYYPGKAYLSNGDPGYPDEYDYDDPEFEDFTEEDADAELYDFGTNSNENDPVVADLISYVNLYMDNLRDDISKHPDCYFEV